MGSYQMDLVMVSFHSVVEAVEDVAEHFCRHAVKFSFSSVENEVSDSDLHCVDFLIFSS